MVWHSCAVCPSCVAHSIMFRCSLNNVISLLFLINSEFKVSVLNLLLRGFGVAGWVSVH
jgi:hypothetical protein